MLTTEEALQLVQDKWQSVNSPGTIRKKDTYIKRFRLMAEEKGFGAVHPSGNLFHSCNSPFVSQKELYEICIS